MKKYKNSKKVAAVAAIAGLVLGGFGGALFFPKEVVQTQVVEKTVTKTEYVDVPVEVVKEVPVEVSVEVPVDNGNLQAVLDEIYDNNGNVEYLIDDLDSDELDQVVDRIVFVNDIKSLAVAEVKKELADLVDKEVVNGVELDEDDVERVRLDDDADEIIVEDIDFEDGDADVYIVGEFEHDNVDYDFEVKVEFKDGEVDDIELISLNEQ